MTVKRVLTWVGGLVVVVVALGASVHAAAPAGHGPEDCLTCAICSCLESLFS